MFARVQRKNRGIIARLWRLTEDDHVERRFTREHRFQIGIMRHAIGPRIAAGDGNEFDAVGPGDCRKMLVAGDLAKADKAEF